MARSQDLKKFRETHFISYMDNQEMRFDSAISKGERVKLCSSDDFTEVIEEFEEKYAYGRAPIMIGHVGGFYVTASLAGLSERVCTTKPYVLFFDRKLANIENAIFNTLLMKSCDTKEEYITALFGLSKADIIKALKPSLYASYIERCLSWEEDLSEMSAKERKELVKELYKDRQEEIDEEIAKTFVDDDELKEVLANEFNLAKVKKYAESRPYEPATHAVLLAKHAKEKLDAKEYETFLKLTSHMTSYLGRGDNFEDLLHYLTEDIKKNGEKHILANDSIFTGYKNLFAGRGSYVKFLGGVDISTRKGVKKLEDTLRRDGFISDSIKENQFAIDLAFIPHMNQVKEAYPLLKKHVQDYIMLYRENPRNKSYFVLNSTATLDVKTLASIGASFIEEERKNRKELKNLSEIEPRKGYPLLMFMGNAPFGNIYHSEVDTNNLVDMAIANKADTVFVQGLIYSTYYHNQTSRRLLTDPTYETLSSRLQAAKKLVEKLNDAGVKVVYQMGDEEHQLYRDIFTIYVREQGVKGNNFLKREDLKSKFDWVRPIIMQDLIPYMIRSGEDVANLNTDDETKTNVSKVLHAIKRYKEGLPLGDSVELKPEFLKDSEMFRVLYSDIHQYSEVDSKIATNLIASNGRSARGKSNVMKNLRLYQSNVVERAKITGIPELFIDLKQPFMSISFEGDEITMNGPSLVNDSYYMEHPELLAGIKENVLEDPTYKRVNQVTKKPNYPGGWMITGDLRDRMEIVPYYKRVKELMDEVQKTGQGYGLVTVGNFNDIHIGSLAERPEYFVKFMDYLFYECNPTGLILNGDIQQGHNYGKYPNESRHMGAVAMTQQMISANKLMRPYLRDGFGVLRDGFKATTDTYQIDDNASRRIIDHLTSIGLLENSQGLYGNVDRVKRNIDYKTVDLKLPSELKRFEGSIREKLTGIINLEFIDALRGNHEENSDWDNKGYDEIELLRQELEALKTFSGSDVDLTLTEFLVNGKGDFVNAPYCFRTINGYNNIYSHSFKGGGSSPTVAASRWLTRMAPSLPRIDKVNAAHYHVFETSVIDNTLITITGAGCGQSGFEQKLGYSSQPLFVVEKYLEDGRIVIETVGAEFLEQYQIKNPYVKEMGLENFIQSCMTEEATIFADKEPDKIHPVYQRKLVARKPNTPIGGSDNKKA